MNIAVLHAPTPEGDAALTAASQRARETSAPLTVLIVHHESPATEVAAAAVRESVADSVRATVGDTETRYRELGPSNGADAIATAEQTIALLREQIEAHRELSSSLAID